MDKHPLDYSLSSDDVKKIVGEDIPVVPSSQYNNFNTIEELFQGGDKVLLLYEDSRDNNTIRGHWCALSIMDKDNIAFFDSYGTNIDDQLLNIPEEYRLENNMMYRFISNLLINSPHKNIHYNPHRLQNGDYETCGRWCGFYLKNNIDPEDFKDYIDELVKLTGIKNKDDLIIDLTEHYL